MLEKHLRIFYFLVIAGFIGGVPAAIISFIFRSNDTVLVTVFTLCTFVTALIYPNCRKKESLNKEVVDFWYYFLAMVAVILFYSHDSSQREKLKSYDEYQRLHNTKADLERKLSALRSIALDTDGAYRAITIKARNNESYAAAVAHPFCDRLVIDRTGKVRLRRF